VVVLIFVEAGISCSIRKGDDVDDEHTKLTRKFAALFLIRFVLPTLTSYTLSLIMALPALNPEFNGRTKQTCVLC